MQKDTIKLFVNGDVKTPERKFGDAGIDFFVPNKTKQFIKDLENKNPKSLRLVNEGIELYPGKDILIPTYIHSRFSSKWCLRASNKSGIATKQKLRIGAEIIDSSYEGIIHVHLFNDGESVQIIKYGQKIVQFVPIKVNDSDIEIFYSEDLIKVDEILTEENIDNEEIDTQKVDNQKIDSNYITFEEFYKDHNSERGDGGFGHTGI